MGFGPCGMGHPGFFWGLGFLYKHRRIIPEKELFLHDIDVRTHVPIRYSNSVLFHNNLAPSLLQKIASKKLMMNLYV